jgi:FkbH-like protein
VRSLSDAPILIADSSRPGDPTNAMLNAIASDIPGVAICEQSAVADKLGAGFLDSRMTALAGMNLSGAACLEIARMFGLVWIPAAVRPRVKAIAIDLDNTLYAGVLGEDGPHGICLTEAHRELQRVLLQYRENGVFLALVSKNEAEDVLNMFAARPEFPLKFEHFSAQNINWDVKSKALQKIASQLRIGVDAILFVDDNPGELADVASSLPGVQCLYAADPGEAARGLTLYPGLAGAKHTTEDRVRVRDLEAAQLRDRLRDSAADPKEYLRSLGVRLCFEFDPEPQLRRAHELSGKTNQFNTAFLRLSEAAIAQRLRDPRFATVTVALRDKLSDSGVIAAIFCEWRGADLCVNEIVISCRALGRGLETAIVAEAIRGMVERARRTLPVRVCFAFTPGERNGPARTWLETFTGVAASGGSVAFEWSGPPECLAGLEGLISIEWNGSK